MTLDNDKSKKFGWIYLSWGKGTVHESPEGLKHFRQGEWNSVRIRIEGEPARIQVWLNGVHIADFQHTEETTEDVEESIPSTGETRQTGIAQTGLAWPALPPRSETRSSPVRVAVG